MRLDRPSARQHDEHRDDDERCPKQPQRGVAGPRDDQPRAKAGGRGRTPDEGVGQALDARPFGEAQVLEIFNVSKVGKIAGCRVLDGVVQRGAHVRLIRDNVVIHEGKLSQLKRFKDDAREVTAGQDCGMSFENYQDMRVGDVIECYRVEEVKRSL